MPATKQAARRVLVTGGAGFIGGSLSIALARRGFDVTAVDNLKRRGAELNLPRLQSAGVEFQHADVRSASDMQSLDEHEALVECSAEPSVSAGYGDTAYVYETNLTGAYNCLELAGRNSAQIVFLSTSRVYPIAHLRDVALEEQETRYEISADQKLSGVSPQGISEQFPLDGARTLYGATKLAAELLIAEYRDSHGIAATVNRCGVVAGPWQMGKVDQGVFTHWVLSHYFKRPLKYIGFGGSGKQVRDLLHVDDLIQLVEDQLGDPQRWDGRTFNVGGGHEVSLSLREATDLCEDLTGNRLEVGADLADRPGDVPLYISDHSALSDFCGWRPQRSASDVMADTFGWISENEATLQSALV